MTTGTVHDAFPRADRDVSPITVLLVEDDPGDVRLTREALRDSKLINQLLVASDGDEAMRFLRQEQEHVDSPRPDLVLLDLNLPRRGGLEVLADMKADAELSTIPVTILTTSTAESDILRSYELHANAYVTKPVDLEQFLEAVAQIESFWVQIVKLPPRGRM